MLPPALRQQEEAAFQIFQDNARSWLLWAFAFITLTLLTQIGGIVLAAALVVRRVAKLGRWIGIGVFLSLYLVATIFLVPSIAPVFGREALSCMSGNSPYHAQSLLYCLANRHYVRPHVKAALQRISHKIAARFPGTVMTYLDAGFPFIDGFPLLPHLSHKDGRKLDIALFYKGHESGGAWPVGYWAFPKVTADSTSACAKDGFFRWDMPWLQPLLPEYQLDEARTQALIFAIAQERPQKIFLEPHLMSRLQVTHPSIMFAGCHAARHDDHVHVQWQ